MLLGYFHDCSLKMSNVTYEAVMTCVELPVLSKKRKRNRIGYAFG